MIKKFILCLLASWLTLLPADDEKIEPTSSKLYRSLEKGAKRAVVALPFDLTIIIKQLTGAPYKNIPSIFFKADTHLSKILSTQFFETCLRSEVIYNLYPWAKTQTNKYFPDLSAKYSILPTLIATGAISLSDVICANPFERMKVCFTNNLKIPFYEEERFKPIEMLTNHRWLFKGGTITFLSSFAHVGTFLSLNHYLKQYLFDKDGPLTIYESLIIGMAISPVQATLTYPFLTFRAKLHAEQLLTLGQKQKEISATQYFISLIKNGSA